jgi:hypothetical protein
MKYLATGRVHLSSLCAHFIRLILNLILTDLEGSATRNFQKNSK